VQRETKAAANRGADVDELKAVQEDADDDPSENILKSIRTRYGIREGPDPFEGTGVDPHLAPRDPDHLLKFGLTIVLLMAVLAILSAAARAQITVRLRDFPWASNFKRITFDLSKAAGARYSMEYTEKLLLVTFCCLLDLLAADHSEVVVKYVQLRNLIYCTSHNDSSILKAQRLTDEWLVLVQRVLPGVFDLPNGHNLRELVYRDLVIWGDVRLMRTSQGELHHQRTIGL